MTAEISSPWMLRGMPLSPRYVVKRLPGDDRGLSDEFKGSSLDAFHLKLNPSSTALTYSTYLGGTGTDFAVGLALDGSGNAYVVGSTSSADFPTLNPIQKQLNGTTNGFVTKLNTYGTALVYSTWLGGGTGDFASAVAVQFSVTPI